MARRFRWTRPTGELAVTSCRLLLWRLARRGFIRWPAPPRRGPAAAPGRPGAGPAEEPRDWGPGAASPAGPGPLVVRPIVPAEAPARREAMAFPPQHTTVDKGHGRIEERRLWASDELAGYSEFPYLRQAFRIERLVTTLAGTPLRTEVS